MRLGWVMLALSASCTPAPPAVEIAAPLASVTVIAPAKASPFSPSAALATSDGRGAWAAEFPKGKSFETHDASAANAVLLTWRVGESRAVNGVDGDDEGYPANHVSPVDLVVRAGKTERAIALGELPGSVELGLVSWCGRTGWHTSSGASWKREHPAIASTFSLGLMQGNDDFAIVRDGATLHVIHRETSDGHCEMKKQGPLEVCEGFEWHLVADVRVSPSADLWEIAVDEGKDLDCGAERITERLTRP